MLGGNARQEAFLRNIIYIEGIAGYLEMAFNPFASHGHSGTGEMESTVEMQEKMGRVEPEVSVQITPPTPDK